MAPIRTIQISHQFLPSHNTAPLSPRFLAARRAAWSPAGNFAASSAASRGNSARYGGGPGRIGGSLGPWVAVLKPKELGGCQVLVIRTKHIGKNKVPVKDVHDFESLAQNEGFSSDM